MVCGGTIFITAVNNLIWVILATSVSEYCRSCIINYWWFAETFEYLYIQQTIKFKKHFDQLIIISGRKVVMSLSRILASIKWLKSAFISWGDRCAQMSCRTYITIPAIYVNLSNWLHVHIAAAQESLWILLILFVVTLFKSWVAVGFLDL